MCQLFLPHSLQHLSLSELWALHSKILIELTRSDIGSPERRNALASLENIERAMRR